MKNHFAKRKVKCTEYLAEHNNNYSIVNAQFSNMNLDMLQLLLAVNIDLE